MGYYREFITEELFLYALENDNNNFMQRALLMGAFDKQTFIKDKVIKQMLLYLEDGIPVRPAGFCTVNQLIEVGSELASSIEVIRGPGNALLPLPPMLMFDRITNIDEVGGKYAKGEIVAELDVNPDLWFFKCHFETDPVMPGCLGLDAMWQLIGFYLGWKGGPGHGRALGAGEVKYFGQVLPQAKQVTYRIDIKRVIMRKLVMGIGDATMDVDGREIYNAKDLRVGLFTSTAEF